MAISSPFRFTDIFLKEPLVVGPPEKNSTFDIFDNELTVYAPGLNAFPKTKI